MGDTQTYLSLPGKTGGGGAGDVQILSHNTWASRIEGLRPSPRLRRVDLDLTSGLSQWAHGF